MAVKSGNVGPTGGNVNFATGPATLYSVHWSSATAGAGTVDLRDGLTPTATLSRVVLDTPAVGGANAAAGDFSVGGGGLHFNTGISVVRTNTGGVTITYATGIRG